VLQFYTRDRYGIVNSVQAAFAMASYGPPAVVIGTDTRAHMSEQFQLDNAFVASVVSYTLNQHVHLLRDESESYATSFESLRQDAEVRYLSLLKNAIHSRIPQSQSNRERSD
jgi:hypothetical protein